MPNSRILETKHAEFHALGLVLDTGYDDSPIVVPATSDGPGYRLPRTWLGEKVSIHDEIGPDSEKFTRQLVSILRSSA